jgi:hypothetical protein
MVAFVDRPMQESQGAAAPLPLAGPLLQDMFVDCDLAQDTVAQIKGMRQWVTSEYMHCGLREAGGTIFEKLLNIARGGILLR